MPPRWDEVAAEIQRELRDVRDLFAADWAVYWGPIPFDDNSPFVCVLFEDRRSDRPSALGLAVPLLGNPWAQAILHEGGAVATDTRGDDRLRFHARLLAQNKIRAMASGSYRKDQQVWGVVEVYSCGAITLPPEPIKVLCEACSRLAEIARTLPATPDPSPPTPAADALTAAALHDLKSALSAQSLLIASFEKELRAMTLQPAPDLSRLGTMIDSLSVLRESVAHANELTRVMTLGTLGPRARITIDLPGVIKLALATVPSDLRERVIVEQDAALGTLGVVRDAPALLRAVVNLVQNAALAVQREPGAQVYVRLRREGDDALIEVEDQGRGVPPEVLGRLFQPGATTRAPAGGHGYGLFSARTTVESMGGSLTLYSVPRRGARFIIRLPREAAGAGQD